MYYSLKKMQTKILVRVLVKNMVRIVYVMMRGIADAKPQHHHLVNAKKVRYVNVMMMAANV